MEAQGATQVENVVQYGQYLHQSEKLSETTFSDATGDTECVHTDVIGVHKHL